MVVDTFHFISWHSLNRMNFQVPFFRYNVVFGVFLGDFTVVVWLAQGRMFDNTGSSCYSRARGQDRRIQRDQFILLIRVPFIWRFDWHTQIGWELDGCWWFKSIPELQDGDSKNEERRDTLTQEYIFTEKQRCWQFDDWFTSADLLVTWLPGWDVTRSTWQYWTIRDQAIVYVIICQSLLSVIYQSDKHCEIFQRSSVWLFYS